MKFLNDKQGQDEEQQVSILLRPRQILEIWMKLEDVDLST
jgi:hypothetical protein